MSTANGSAVSFTMSDGNTGKQHSELTYSITTTDTTVTIKITKGVLGRNKGMTITPSYWKWTLSGTGQTTKTGTPSSASYGTSDVTCFSSTTTWSWSRGTSAATKTVKFATQYTQKSGQPASTATVSVSVPALKSVTIGYNANGGTGAPASQTKYYSQALNLQTGVPSRTGYTLRTGTSRWNTASGGTGTGYSSGQQLAASFLTAMMLYAQWDENSYSVTYDANGGTGAPASQTRKYTQSATLPSTVPTRHLYRFTGWNTAADGSGAAYQPGATIPANTASNVALHAMWANNYTPPAITGISAVRCDASGNPTDGDDGTYAALSITWNVDTLPDEGGKNSGTVTATKAESGGTASSVTLGGTKAGGGGTATAIVPGLDVEKSYTLTATVTDGEGNKSVASVTVQKQEFQLDFSPEGGIGLGTPAAARKLLSIAMDMAVTTWAGVIQMFAGPTPPAGWLLCDGSAVSRADYATLFAAIGETWGAGDGSTTFNLPDLRGRAPIGAGTGSGLTARTLGGTVGAESVTLTAAQSGLQAHTHGLGTETNPYVQHSSVAGSTDTYNGDASGSGSKFRKIPSSATYGGGVTETRTKTAVNATQAHNNMQPSAVVNFIIHTGKTS